MIQAIQQRNRHWEVTHGPELLADAFLPARAPKDSGLEALILVARYHEIPVSKEQLTHHFIRPGGVSETSDLIRAARQLGMKTRRATLDWAKLTEASLPAIARHKNGRFFVLAQAAKDRVLILDPLEGKPRKVQRAEFEAGWSGELIFLTRRAGLAQAATQFDFSWFIPSIVKYRRLLGEVLIASFFLQLFALITPLFFQVVIDKVLVHRALTTLDVLAVGLLTVSLFEVVLGGLRTWLYSHTTYRIDVKLGADLFSHMMALPIAYFENRRVGDLVARVRELESIRSFMTGSALTVLVDSFFTLVFILIMYFYSPLLTLVVVGAIPFYVLLAIFVTPVLRARLHEKFNRGAENQAFLVEIINGMETVKSSAVEPHLERRWEEQLAEYVRVSFRATNLGNISSQIAGLINKVSTVLILWIGARLVIDGQLTVGQLVAFNMLAGRVSGPILRLVQLWQDFQQAGISVQRLGDILNAKPEPKFNPNRTTLPSLRGEVSFEHVSFRYRPDTATVLQDINLLIPAGQVVGIVGASGSGKSTLTKLVQRLHVPEQGRVLVDGIDLSLVEPSWLRRQVGVVLQENVLFNRKVRDNIAFADPAASMERIVEVATLAGAHEFILQLPEGYDTLIGEHGSNLSGGQKQRIAIARALLTNPRILILDEATSALDYESERIVRENLKTICKNRTVFIIAHRLSTIQDADRIVVIDKGCIVEQGTIDELTRAKGYFARLQQMQASGG